MEGKYDEQIKEYRTRGMKYFEIAKALHADDHNIRKRCLQLGLGYKETETRKANHEKYIRSKGFEYISGFTGYRGNVTVKCSKCGEITQKRYKYFVDPGGVGCDNCRRIEREDRENEKQRIKEERRISREKAREERKQIIEKEKIKKTEERIRNGRQMVFGSCPICGSLFYGNKKYCSKHCRIKQERRNRETTRRIRTSEGLIDKDITLEKLYIRDGGVCYLCGRSCDWGDFTIKGENFIVGTTYPSIDHVKPLSKGGRHSWDNVKLAHFVCNSLKSDK